MRDVRILFLWPLWLLCLGQAAPEHYGDPSSARFRILREAQMAVSFLHLTDPGDGPLVRLYGDRRDIRYVVRGM